MIEVEDLHHSLEILQLSESPHQILLIYRQDVITCPNSLNVTFCFFCLIFSDKQTRQGNLGKQQERNNATEVLEKCFQGIVTEVEDGDTKDIVRWREGERDEEREQEWPS
ncbi:hypothetical protein Q8A67_012659 [Cirrhinus molitorella]|uniref:Uncharacterized protein n=1 Tax=Cirrhinus molitorella TaxID=172907 RepID=A0AA88PJW4_9TELE|nr:hypothetical protein Q8A67_012659 [Cirrhinus molitorella]